MNIYYVCIRSTVINQRESDDAPHVSINIPIRAASKAEAGKKLADALAALVQKSEVPMIAGGRDA